MDKKEQQELKNKAQERLDSARKTLKTLTNKKEERIEIYKKSMINYCNETIGFCESVLALINNKEEK